MLKCLKLFDELDCVNRERDPRASEDLVYHFMCEGIFLLIFLFFFLFLRSYSLQSIPEDLAQYI